MILSARSMSRSSEQSTKRESRSKDVRKVGLFYGVIMIKHDRHILEKFTRFAKVRGLLFPLDCAFRVLTGWAGKLRSSSLVGLVVFCLWSTVDEGRGIYLAR